MQHDDDPRRRATRRIKASSQFKRVPNVSRATVELVVKIANQYPDLGPQRVLAIARESRKDITLDEVRTILS